MGKEISIIIEQGAIGGQQRLYADLAGEDVPETSLGDQDIMEYCWLDKMDIRV